jgi:hypothetical protein
MSGSNILCVVDPTPFLTDFEREKMQRAISELKTSINKGLEFGDKFQLK